MHLFSQGEVVQHYGPGHHIQPAHYVHPQLMYQQYFREAALGSTPYHRGPGKNILTNSCRTNLMKITN